MSTPEESLEAEEQISEELLQIHHDSYGRGAGRARTYILEDDVICFMDDLELQPSEEFLIDSGHSDMVINVRCKFEQAIEASYVSVVERATGRRVVTFMSNTGLDPNFALEVFRLESHS